MFLVWVFWLWLRPLFVLFCCVSCWRNANLAGRFACRRCFAWFLFVCVWICLELWNQGVYFIMFAFYLPASLIVRTEPQSEIGRNRGKKTSCTPCASKAIVMYPDVTMCSICMDGMWHSIMSARNVAGSSNGEL